MKSAQKHKIFIAVILLVLAMYACNLPGQTAISTPDLSLIVAQTQTAMAVSWYLTGIVPAQIPTSAATPQAPVSTTASTPGAASVTPNQPLSTQPPQVTSEYQPTATNNPPTAISCSNAAKFITETIPDGSNFNPGQQFVKSWTLQNAGTCIWMPDYVLVHVNGEQLGGPSPLPIGQTVPPGGTIQLNVPLTAPQNYGNFQGYWKLRSQTGQLFGLGKDAQVPFWVKISVASGPSASTPFAGPQSLGKPTWVETFDSKHSPWYLGTDSGIDYDLKNGRLTITASKPTGDKWRVAQPGFLSDFYLEASFTTGSACSGKDGYGFIVRAPEKANRVIDSGYVFSFSCDGKYRVYRIDNGAFESIQNWTSNAAINHGANQTNVMGIYAVGDELRLYANGVLVMKFSDAVYSEGLFGLMIRAESSNFQFHVDEVKIWNIH